MSSENQHILFEISDDVRDAAENEIREKQKIADYDIREYPIEVIVSKFTVGLDKDEAEIFIPEYQRELIWSNYQQSRFIESILLNLPIPYLFVADTKDGPRAGNLEIVDGSQRIRTLVRFISNHLMLEKLDILRKLNGFRFCNLPAPRQLRFKRKTLRMIELTDQADEESRRMMFDRLNSGGTKLVGMEQRRGSHDGVFLNFIRRIADKNAFKELCPLSETRNKHKEYEELALRFFAYLDRYQSFEKRVDLFLTEYLKEKNSTVPNIEELEVEFDRMLEFVAHHFTNGFRKAASHDTVPRIRFESIAVGVALALRENPELVPESTTRWLESEKFKKLTRSDASNSRPKLMARIHFVRDSLFGRETEIDDDAPSNEDIFSSPDDLFGSL